MWRWSMTQRLSSRCAYRAARHVPSGRSPDVPSSIGTLAPASPGKAVVRLTLGRSSVLQPTAEHRQLAQVQPVRHELVRVHVPVVLDPRRELAPRLKRLEHDPPAVARFELTTVQG